MRQRIHRLIIAIGFLTPALADRPDLWLDERIVLRMHAQFDVWGMIVELPTIQPHMPGWYVLLALFGPAIMAALSWVTLGFTTWGTIRLAERFDTSTPAVAGLFIALSPYLARQASWIRMYGLLTAIMVWGLYWAHADRQRYALGAFVVATLVHPFGFFGIVWFGMRYIRLHGVSRRMSAALGLSTLPIIAFLALKSNGFREFSVQTTTLSHGEFPAFDHLFFLPLSTVFSVPAKLIQVIALGGMTAIGLYGLRSADTELQDLLLWIALPILVATVTSYLVYPLFRLKYFGFIAPAVAIYLSTLYRFRFGIALGSAIAYLFGWVHTTMDMAISRRFFYWFL